MEPTLFRIRSRVVDVPLKEALPTPVGLLASHTYVLVEIESTSGKSGFGYVRAYEATTVHAVQAFIAGLADLVLGLSVYDTERAYAAMIGMFTLLGRAGPQMYALSAIDTALWDLKARELNIPLYRLLGGARDSIPAYASGLYLSSPIEALPDEIIEIRAQGFDAVKMRVGLKDIREDVRRAVAVREVFDGKLMFEAATAWTRTSALQAARELSIVNPYWVEDPVPMHMSHDLKALREQGAVPIAGGEHAYSEKVVLDLMERNVYDYLILDLQRVGGVTGWIRANAIAQTYGRQVSAHVFPEISVQLLCGLPNAHMLEYLPWSYELFTNPPVVENGTVRPPQGAGLGLELNEELIAAHLQADLVVNATEKAR